MYQGNIINKNYIKAFFLFLLGEFFVFVSVFWLWNHNFLVPTHVIGSIWPGCTYTILDYNGISSYNTFILLLSSFYLNLFETARKQKKSGTEVHGSFMAAALLGLHFLLCQFIKFSRLPFTMTDSVYATCFYTVTGLHLCHVIVGVLLLTLAYLLINYNKNNNRYVLKII